MATNTNMKWVAVDGTGRTRKGLLEYIGRTFRQVRWGLSPLWAMLTAVTVFGSYVGYRAIQKSDIYINRARKTAPWEWERAKDQYDKTHRILRDHPSIWKRIPELDALQEEMEVEERSLGLK